jgi:hypothetical protein
MNWSFVALMVAETKSTALLVSDFLIGYRNLEKTQLNFFSLSGTNFRNKTTKSSKITEE